MTACVTVVFFFGEVGGRKLFQKCQHLYSAKLARETGENREHIPMTQLVIAKTWLHFVSVLKTDGRKDTQSVCCTFSKLQHALTWHTRGKAHENGASRNFGPLRSKHVWSNNTAVASY